MGGTEMKCFTKRKSLRLFWLSLAGAVAFSGAAFAETTITYWDFVKPGDGPRGIGLKAVIDGFEAENPDIKVNVEIVAPSMIDPNLIQGAAAGVTPDVIKVHQYKLAMDVDAGALLPLDELAAKMDKTDWLLPWDSTKIGDKKYDIPYVYRFNTLQYRKDLLDAAGVGIPTTWDEMCESASKINSGKVLGFSMGLLRAGGAFSVSEWFENDMLAAGAPIFDEKGRAAFNTEAGLKPFETVKRLMDCGASSKAIVDQAYNELTDGMASGTIAMVSLGTHRYETIRSRGAGDNLGWSHPMSYKKGEIPPIALVGYSLAVGVHSKNPEAAFKFIEYMTRPASQEIMAKAGELPTRKSAYDLPYFSTPEAATAVAWSKFIAEHGVVKSYPVEWSDFALLLSDAMQSIVLQGVAPAEARDKLIEQYNTLIDQR
jgi:ABC-type glycerol-3-phosphate transport system substrate-binding protein